MTENVISSPGGKYLLRHKIISYFHSHHAYIEVFGGAAHTLLAKSPSPLEVYNDVNGDLYSFYKILRDEPEKFMHAVEFTPYCRRTFNELKAMKPADDFERAWRFYCLNRMSWGGYRPEKANFGCRVKHRIPFHKFEKILPVVDRLRGVIIENLDFRELLQKYDGENCLFYNDPPYYGSENKYNGDYEVFSDKDHTDLFELLKNLKAKWLLSYNDCEVVREIYKNFSTREVVAYERINLRKDGEERLKRRELLISNYDLGVFNTPLLNYLNGRME